MIVKLPIAQTPWINPQVRILWDTIPLSLCIGNNCHTCLEAIAINIIGNLSKMPYRQPRQNAVNCLKA
ncbi:MAG: hypothetical protein AAF622_05405 [Cyanobacteria bacterium P01_C01_bin.147]